MEIERNVVFIYPLTNKLEELKSLIEAEHSDVMVYEMTSVAEFVQLIGIMEYSVTFSSDMHKTEEYLKKTSMFVKNVNANNCIVLNSTFPPHITARLTAAGLNKIFLEKEVDAKELWDYTNHFFERAAKGELNQIDAPEIGATIGSGTKKKVEAETDHYMVKNLTKEIGTAGKLDQEHQKVSVNKNLLIGSNLQKNLVLKRSALGASFLGSPFDNLMRKNVKTFEPYLKKQKEKKKPLQFKEVERQYQRKKHPDIGLKEVGSLKKKNMSFTPVERKQKKQGKFEPVTREYEQKKRAQFQEVERSKQRAKLRENKKREMQRRQAMFKAVERKLEKKRKKFEEVQRELARKKTEAKTPLEREQLEKELEKNRKEYERKRGRFEEVKRQYEHAQKKMKEAKEHEWEEIEKELKKYSERNKEIWEELEKEGPQWDKNIVELSREYHFPEPEEEVEKKGPEWERGLFNEEVPWNELFLDDADSDFKINNLLIGEESKAKKEKDNQEELIELEKAEVSQESLSRLLKKEQVLNYKDFTTKRKTGELNLTEEELAHMQAMLYESELAEIDKKYFLPETMGLEYILLYNDLLHNLQAESTHLCRMIQFAYKKEYDSPLSVYILNKDMPGGLTQIFEGHLENNTFFSKDEYEIYKTDRFEILKNEKLPRFSDETYLSDKNEFIYPYFTDGVHQGFLVAHFHPFEQGHQDAKKIEMLALTLQGVVQQEFQKIKGEE